MLSRARLLVLAGVLGCSSPPSADGAADAARALGPGRPDGPVHRDGPASGDGGAGPDAPARADAPRAPDGATRRDAGAARDAATSDGPGPDAPPPGDAAAPGDGPACEDRCPFAGGIAWGCERRFMYGINYAWRSFGADFGGIAAWGQPGVAADPEPHARNLARMAAHGASVVRWWLYPDLRGDAIRFEGDLPAGLGGTVAADLARALELAEQADVYLMPTLFSFDAFRPDADVAGIWVRGLAPIARDPARRAALVERVVRPTAAIVERSPYRRRVIAWDLVNEPEWAMTGPSPLGDQPYDPTAGLEALDHDGMETFVRALAAGVRAESSALVTVGGASLKWARAWTRVGADFYALHHYGWANPYWPYTDPPATYGLDRPIVFGELPLGELVPGAPFAQVVGTWYDAGYAGALGWAYDDATDAALTEMAGFAARHACETRYGAPAMPLAGGAPAPRVERSIVSVRRCRRDASGKPDCS